MTDDASRPLPGRIRARMFERGWQIRPPERAQDKHTCYDDDFELSLASHEDVGIAYDEMRQQIYLYRPNQLVVAPDRVDDVLAAVGIDVSACELDSLFADHDGKVGNDGDGNDGRDGRSSGAVRIRFPVRIRVPELVQHFRSSERFGATDVGPNHVLLGMQRIKGWPAGPPEPVEGEGLAAHLALLAERADQAKQASGARRPVTIAVIDTGLARTHLGMPAVDAKDPDDLDLLDLDPVDKVNDLEAGHGTFVAGIIRSLVPSARIVIVKAIEPSGIADCFAISRALVLLARWRDENGRGVDIVNLSLGGWTADNLPPLGMEEAIRYLSRRLPEALVVAAAGNASTSRPPWPAAFKDVVAVAAVGAGASGWEPAPFTDRGWWVDACAPGVDIVSDFPDGTRGFVGPNLEDFVAPYACWSGTSFSAPHVVGRLAQLMQAEGVDAKTAAFRLLKAPGLVDFAPGMGVLVS